MPHIIRMDDRDGDRGIFEVLVTGNPAGVQIDTVYGSVELSRESAEWLLDTALPAMLHYQREAARTDPRGLGDGLGS